MPVIPDLIDVKNRQHAIHQGNRTRIYRAVSRENGGSVILKTPSYHRPSPERIDRYQNEYTILRSFSPSSHPNIIHSIDLIIQNHTPYLVLEDFIGMDLAALQRSAAPLPLEQVLDIAVKTSLALGQISRSRIVHKGISPANILYDPETGALKLIDFSAASVLTAPSVPIEEPMVAETFLPYMSPEQTGKMNRPVDWRTDYYSLGVTLYELLTGSLPFQDTSALALFHAHMAMEPVPPHEINKFLPEALSPIIQKLMAKDREERYQGYFGIHHDLSHCLNEIRGSGQIRPFEIGTKDFSDRLVPYQALHGRESEVQDLLAVLPPACPERSAPILVTGPAGVGKSELVREVRRNLVNAWAARQKKGKKEEIHFISGKCDQLKKSTPYAALIQAFQELIKKILTQDIVRVAQWKERLLTALGPNGRIITDVIPEVELITGEQPDVPQLGPVEAPNRFHYAFGKFIRAFGAKDHPLVIFLDDLQWADPASLKLMATFITGNTPHVYFIGAYREDEIGPSHPLMPALEAIRKNGTCVEMIRLRPLEECQVNQWVSEMLSCDLERSKPFSDVCVSKTRGNPFFIQQFIHSLIRENLIEFNHETGRWEWDINGIIQADFTDNVIDFMNARITKLSKKTGRILSMAACIGNQFDIATLSGLYGKPIGATAVDLMEALQEGLILPLEANCRNLQNPDPFPGGAADPPPGHPHPPYRFLHDRIQQSAYGMINGDTRTGIHLEIGRRMLKSIPEHQMEERIFQLVDQLNLGISLLANDMEREMLAELNLRAGIKAKRSVAYAPAFDYLYTGIQLLGENPWKTRYGLTLSLYEEAAEAACLCNRYREMETLARTILQHARTVLDTIKAYEVIIQAHTARHQLQDAVRTGLDALQNLGLSIPRNPNRYHVLAAYAKARLAMAGKNPGKLIRMDEMTAPYPLARMRILARVTKPVYYAAPQFLPFTVLNGVALCARYGNATDSILSYGAYGMILCGSIGDITSGFAFGNLTLELLKKIPSDPVEVQARMLVNVSILHWKKHLRETLAPFEEGYLKGREMGDFEHAGVCACCYSNYAYFAGTKLSELEKKADRYNDGMIQLKQDTWAYHNQRTWQVVLNLMGKNGNPTRLKGEVYDEEKMRLRYQKENDLNGLCYLHLDKLILHYLFRDHDKAVENAAIVETHLAAVISQASVPVFYFYDSLARLARFPTLPAPAKNQTLKRVGNSQKKMKKWAAHAPMNLAHKWHLVQAEKYRILGNHEKAAGLYETAIAGARKNRYIQEEALANELAATFYLELGDLSSAEKHIKDAIFCYTHWGATAKAAHLEQVFAQLTISVPAPSPAIFQDSSGHLPIHHSRLDLLSVMKASQVISGETGMEPLLSGLMGIIIENAGAQYGYLIIKHKGGLFIEARVSLGHTKVFTPHLPLDSCGDLCPAAIYYVERTGKDILLNDAARDDLFAKDPFVLKNRIKSLLCMPIMDHGNITGAFYLENRKMTGVFTPERVEILRTVSEILANARARNQAEKEVLEYQDRLRSLSSQLLYAEEKERRTMALALHDNIGHSLSHAAMEIEKLKQDTGKNLAPRFDVLHSIINETIKATHTLTFELSPPILYDLGLAAALDWLAEQTANKHSIPVEFKGVPISADMDESGAILLFQCVRELLFNMAKHARATRACITMEINGPDLEIIVEDNGRGFTVSPQNIRQNSRGGFGLFSIQERLGSRGGYMDIESAPGQGARISLVLPMNQPHEKHKDKKK